LTLLGGLGAWFAEQHTHKQQQQLLQQNGGAGMSSGGGNVNGGDLLDVVLPALLRTLRSQDEKLARNAATTIYRLAQQGELAGLLLARHQAWVQQVLGHYQSLGGVRQRMGERLSMAA
jgi:hypothetical protein